MRFVNIKKLSGGVEKYSIEKIRKGVEKAFKDAEYDTYVEHVNAVVDGVEKQMAEFSGVFRPTTSQIASIIEDTLVYLNHAKVAKSYILFREDQRRLRNFTDSLKVDIQKLTETYLNRADWRLKENSNFSYSVGGLEFYQSGALNAKYWLDVVYPENISNAHVNGDIHICDLSRLSPYCSGFELKKLIREGFKGVGNNLASKPAKHLRAFVNQIINFIGIESNEFAGAVAINNISTMMAPFVKKDNMTQKQLEQDIQNLVFSLNIPSRFSGQSPFSNVTIDLTIPKDMKDKPAVVGGVDQDFTYGDCEEELKMLNRAFFRVMLEGDAVGKPFSFPIPTINIDQDFDWDDDSLVDMWKATNKYGYFYFANYINSDLSPEDARSMCCRLKLDTREIKRRSSGLLGGSGDVNVGSIGVAVVNLGRIGYLASTKEEYLDLLNERLELCYDSLEIKRKAIESNMQNNLYPYAKWYLGSFDTYFSTIGENGMNESCQNFFGREYGIDSPQGREFTLEVMDFINRKVSEFQERSGNLYNHEQVPGEGLSSRLAQADKKAFPDIITSGEHGDVFYTGSTLLPARHTTDIFDELDHQNDIQVKYTAGCVEHVLLGERVQDIEVTKKLVRTIFTNYEMPYISITPTYSICSEHGYMSGEFFECPQCHNELENIERQIKCLGGDKNG